MKFTMTDSEKIQSILFLTLITISIVNLSFNYVVNHDGYKLRYDRSGSPLKRSVLGSVEIFEKEKTKRTTFFKPSGILISLLNYLEMILIVIFKKGFIVV